MRYSKYTTKKGDKLGLIVYKVAKTNLIKDVLLLNWEAVKNQDIMNMTAGVTIYIPHQTDETKKKDVREALYD